MMTPDCTLEVSTAGFVYRGGTTERGNEQSEVQGRDEGVGEGEGEDQVQIARLNTDEFRRSKSDRKAD